MRGRFTIFLRTRRERFDVSGRSHASQTVSRLASALRLAFRYMHHRIRGYLGSCEARTPYADYTAPSASQLIQISRHICIVSTKLFGDRAINKGSSGSSVTQQKAA